MHKRNSESSNGDLVRVDIKELKCGLQRRFQAEQADLKELKDHRKDFRQQFGHHKGGPQATFGCPHGRLQVTFRRHHGNDGSPDRSRHEDQQKNDKMLEWMS